MLRIGCRRCHTQIRIDMEKAGHRFEHCLCRAVLVEVNPPLSIVYEFERGSAVIVG